MSLTKCPSVTDTEARTDNVQETWGDPSLLPFGATMRYNARGTTHLTLLTLIGHNQEQEGMAIRTRLETDGDALCMTSRQAR
jgi:hypothetical protein